ncbi:MAG: hypothetical protein GMKNLPBB_00131 [Myxococcota bacterium]|nr:hypothetical protein [Myxococcota bacterium]
MLCTLTRSNQEIFSGSRRRPDKLPAKGTAVGDGDTGHDRMEVRRRCRKAAAAPPRARPGSARRRIHPPPGPARETPLRLKRRAIPGLAPPPSARETRNGAARGGRGARVGEADAGDQVGVKNTRTFRIVGSARLFSATRGEFPRNAPGVGSHMRARGAADQNFRGDAGSNMNAGISPH